MARTTDVKVKDVKAVSRTATRPARGAAAPRRLPAFLERWIAYLREVWVELNRVAWPTRREMVSSTVVVLVVLVVLAIYLGIFDYIFTALVRQWLLPNTVR